MPSLKPIILYQDGAGPNPHKVRIILTELNLPFESQNTAFTDLKKEPYVSINPNGRLPSIRDPNTGLTLWESGAIATYLVEQYDKSNKLSYSSFPEKYMQIQWSSFQISGQGPYYGQMVWFQGFHLEKLPSAIGRYNNEICRVRGVLDRALSKKAAEIDDPAYQKTWLVGDKCTIADLSWVMWEHVIDFVWETTLTEVDVAQKWPAYHAWIQRLYARPAVKMSIALRKESMEKSGLLALWSKQLKT